MKDEDLMVLYFYSPPNTFFLSLFPLPLENDMATHSSIRAWEVAWTEESGGLQSGARVVHDWATKPIPSIGFLGGSGVRKKNCLLIQPNTKSVNILFTYIIFITTL